MHEDRVAELQRWQDSGAVWAVISRKGGRVTSCTVPAVGHPKFELSETEIEVGRGIHGEPGRQRMPMQFARAVAELMQPIPRWCVSCRPRPAWLITSSNDATLRALFHHRVEQLLAPFEVRRTGH